MRYTGYLGCRYRGVPHEFTVIFENKRVKREKCLICQKRFTWNKGYKGRVDNQKYLKAHVRAFAQPNGLTKRVFNKAYHPERLKIKI